MKGVDIPKQFWQWLNKGLPFAITWKHVFLIGLTLAIVNLFILFFLEPHGTDRYQVPFRNLKLSGYALCFLIPIMAMHGVDRLVFKKQGYHWFVFNELISKSIVILLIATASYFYNINVINSISPSLQGWMSNFILYGWSYVPILLPIGVGLQSYYAKKAERGAKPLLIKGKNKSDHLEVPFSDFIYAESQQNYVVLHFKKGGRSEKMMMHASLQAIANQIKGAIRIHRSFLINPVHLQKIEGNQRQRFAKLHFVENALPIGREVNSEKLKSWVA